MGEVALDLLPPLPLHPLAPITFHPPPVAVDRCLLRLFAIPLAGPRGPARQYKNALPVRPFQPSHHCCGNPCPLPPLRRLPDVLHTCLRASSRRSSQPASITVSITVVVSAAAPLCVVT